LAIKKVEKKRGVPEKLKKRVTGRNRRVRKVYGGRKENVGHEGKLWGKNTLTSSGVDCREERKIKKMGASGG